MSHSNEPTGNPEERREGGTVMVVVALGLVGLMAFAAVALDGGYMMATRGQLQHVADSGALAGITAIRDGLPAGQARTLAQQTAEDVRHEAGGDPVSIPMSDIEFGTFDLGTGVFSPGRSGTGVSAFRVTARREAGAGAGALDLFFGGVTGMATADVAATSVAAVRRRDVVIVQDRTYSFRQEFDDAIDADLDLVNAMAGPMALSGDRVGVVSFGRVPQEEIGLTELATRKNDVLNTINRLQVCQDTLLSSGCRGTGTGDGIQTAIDVFERDAVNDDGERIMVVVTDGVPCHADLRNSAQWVPAGKVAALAAADRAVAKGINIYVITLAVPVSSSSSACLRPDEAFGASMARGFGYGVSTPNSKDLDDVLISIVNQMPVRLVQ